MLLELITDFHLQVDREDESDSLSRTNLICFNNDVWIFSL